MTRRIKHAKTAVSTPSISYNDWNAWIVDETGAAIDLDDITLGKITIPTESTPLLFASTGGPVPGPWLIENSTALMDTHDHVLAMRYNYKPQAFGDVRYVVDNSIRFGFESSYMGVMEWNLDLSPANGGLTMAPLFRPWLYNYTWAGPQAGTSILAFKGRLDLYQVKDNWTPALRVIPLADNQVSDSFSLTNLALGTLVSFNPAAGLLIKPNAANIVPLQVQGNAAQVANLQNWRDSGLNTLARIAANGSIHSTVGDIIGGGYLQGSYFTPNSQGAGATVLLYRAAGDVQNRFTMDNTGRMDYGTGALATDAIFYRWSAGRFRIVDTLSVDTALQVNGTKVVGARVIDARCDDAINSGDVTTDGVIDSLRDAMIAHGLIAAA